MVGEGTTAIFFTFLLAILGYIGLTGTAVLTVQGRYSPVLWRVVSVVIVAHVFMVWTFRYGWQLDLAVRNGYAGFLLFHAALVIIVLSNLTASEMMTQKLIHIAFGIVTMGALGASFRYEAVEMYGPAVIGCTLAGGYSLGRHYLGRWRLKEPA